jgi:hypothetical protein
MVGKPSLWNQTTRDDQTMILSHHGIFRVAAWLTLTLAAECWLAGVTLQRPDGGWAMASLAPWKRIDKTPQDLANGDGYGTGLVLYVLRVAGGLPLG